MAGRYSPGTTRDLEEFAEATAAAREHRLIVAEQLRELIVSYDVQGNAQLAGSRVKAILGAEATGDTMLLRSAVIEAAVSLGAWAAELDRGTVEGRNLVAARRAAATALEAAA